MESYLDFLKENNIGYKTEGNVVITEDRSFRDLKVNVVDIISDEGRNVSTMVLGLTGTVPFYQKLNLLRFLNDENKKTEDMKFTVSDDSRIVFSINELRAKGSELLPNEIYENRDTIFKYVESYSPLDYIYDHFSKKLDLNAMIAEARSSIAADAAENMINYLRSEGIFCTSRKSKNGETVKFKIVNREENAQEIDIVFSNTGRHKIIYKDVFAGIPEKTPTASLEATAMSNENVKELKFIYDEVQDRTDAVLIYGTGFGVLSGESLYSEVLKYGNAIDDERTNFVKFLISSVDELLIETPEE